MTKDEKRLYDQRRYAEIRQDPVRLAKRKAQCRVASGRFYHRNKEKCLTRLRAWRDKNPDKRLAQKKRWYWRHRAERVEKARDKYWRNVDRNRAQSRAWYAAHREYAGRMAKLWAQRNRARQTQYANNRRSKKADNGGSHTFSEWMALCAAMHGTCFYCQRSDRPLTRDHLTPVSRGGPDDIENIVPACRQCNASKGALTADEYFSALAAGQRIAA